ncbi:MAG: hypothetical protein LBI02_08765, partial [Opitutaceae bacterium]|nr:hypothetical protein [Opitutaceae bacterium]
LHAAANPPKASGAVLGVLTARYADGTETRRELKNKTDIGNWRDPSAGENLGIAWESENATASIGLIGDRVASLVFQRFDIAPAKNAIVYAVNPGEAFESLGRLFPGGFSPLGLVARIGSLPGRPPEVLAQSAAAPLRSQAIAAAVTGGTTENLPPRAYLMDDSLAARLERDGVIPQNAIDTSRTRYASDTGQIELSADAGTVKAVSPRAELFSLAPGAALDGGCVSVADVDARCAIAVVALPASPREARDASGTPPLAAARRILVTHLTNALPQGAIFAHADCKLLKTWGGGPHLVRRGAAVLTLRLAGGDWQAWAVDAAGRRMREVPLARRAGGAFTLALSTITRGGAQLAYELAR